MKIRDYAQSRLDQMAVPVRFTREDLEAAGGSYEGDDEKGTLRFPDRPFHRDQKFDDRETSSLLAYGAKIRSSFEEGTPFYREAARFREIAGVALYSNEGPQPEAGWFTEVAAEPWFEKRASLQPDDPDVTHSAIMTWVSSQLRRVSYTSNWFVPSDPLIYQLLATDLRGVLVGDLTLPFPSFYVELPRGVFYLDGKGTGWHAIRYILVTSGETTEKTAKAHERLGIPAPLLGKRLLVEMYGETNDRSKNPFDDVWAFHSYRLGDPMADLDQAIGDSLDDPEMERSHLRGQIGERRLDGIEVRREVLRFLLNFCIYLGTPEARVENETAAEIERLTKGKKLRNLRKNVQDKVRVLASKEQVLRVGSNVTVESEIRDYALSRIPGEGQKLSYRTVVRGHWRNQAHGPQLSLRSQKWIAPHVRGTSLPDPTVGHQYKVR